MQKKNVPSETSLSLARALQMKKTGEGLLVHPIDLARCSLPIPAGAERTDLIGRHQIGVEMIKKANEVLGLDENDGI